MKTLGNRLPNGSHQASATMPCYIIMIEHLH